jgi:hypothetical protein
MPSVRARERASRKPFLGVLLWHSVLSSMQLPSCIFLLRDKSGLRSLPFLLVYLTQRCLVLWSMGKYI